MADALVHWARKRLKEIAPYHVESFQALSPTVNFQIAIKEILEHLRSMLDYCAREICERVNGAAIESGAKVYFPIVRKGFDKKNFQSLVGRNLPGVLRAREDLLPVLASFQEFSSPRNAWLPDFGTLCNENKHEQLSLQKVVRSQAEISEHEGRPLFTFKRSDKAPMEKGFCFGLLPHPSKADQRLAFYCRFDAIDFEVISFLELAIDGTERIVKELKNKL